jgi:hypothetical protein
MAAADASTGRPFPGNAASHSWSTARRGRRVAATLAGRTIVAPEVERIPDHRASLTGRQRL